MQKGNRLHGGLLHGRDQGRFLLNTSMPDFGHIVPTPTPIQQVIAGSRRGKIVVGGEWVRLGGEKECSGIPHRSSYRVGQFRVFWVFFGELANIQ